MKTIKKKTDREAPPKLSFDQLLYKHDVTKFYRADRKTIIAMLDKSPYREMKEDSPTLLRRLYLTGYIVPDKGFHALSGFVPWVLTPYGEGLALKVKAFDAELNYQREHGHGIV